MGRGRRHELEYLPRYENYLPSSSSFSLNSDHLISKTCQTEQNVDGVLKKCKPSVEATGVGALPPALSKMFEGQLPLCLCCYHVHVGMCAFIYALST